MSEMAAASPAFHHRPQERPVGGAWALRTHLELGALRGAVPCARLHARHVLWEWGLSDLDESVELVVSELVTNAIQASAGLSSDVPGYDEEILGLPCVWLWLASDGRQLVVEVGDSSPRFPALADTEHDVEGGRGLLLVETVSRRWGYYFPAGEDESQQKIIRKVVWALIARP
jgi:anti-sigma regulatory factor (Ser/Thr protein kinase)